jgi:hypothetical protein
VIRESGGSARYLKEIENMFPRKLSDEDLRRIGFAAMGANTNSDIRAIVRKLRRLPEDEMRIALNFGIPFAERLETLTKLRQEKAAKRAARKMAWIAESAPKPFEQNFSETDVIRARGLGIRLD